MVDTVGCSTLRVEGRGMRGRSTVGIPSGNAVPRKDGGRSARIAAVGAVLMSALCLLVACATTQPGAPGSTSATDAENPELNVGLLSPNLYDELIIEVDVAGSCSPDEKALAELVTFARSVLPPVRVSLAGPERILSAEWPRVWTEEEFHRFAAANMRRSGGGSRQALVYVLYVEREETIRDVGGKAVDWHVGTGADAAVVPGMFIVCSALQNALLTFSSRASLEEYVLKHEFGHVVGLVRNPRHESNEAPSHCSRRGCLMESFYEYGLLRYLSLGLPGARLPQGLCEQCIADVAATRERAASRSVEENTRLASMQAELTQFYELIADGDLSSAIDVGRQLGGAYANNREALLAHGTALALAGETDRAVKALSDTLDRGGDVITRLRTARLLCALGAYESATQLIPVEIARENRQAAAVLVWALEGAGRYDEGLDLLQSSMERKSSRGERDIILTNMARLLRISDRPRDAIELLRRQPEKYEYWSPWLLVELSKSFIAVGDREAADETLLAAREVIDRQLLRVSADPYSRADAAAFRVHQVEIDALLNRCQAATAALDGAIASVSELPSYQRSQLGMRIAGALAMCGDIEGAVAWCAKSRGIVMTMADSGADPGLSEAFRPLRESHRTSPRYPWCSVGGGGFEETR